MIETTIGQIGFDSSLAKSLDPATNWRFHCEVMKALNLAEYKKFEYVDAPEPKLEEGEVLIKIKACAGTLDELRRPTVENGIGVSNETIMGDRKLRRTSM